MSKRLVELSVLAVLLCGMTACSVFRPILFWRDTQIVGKVQLVDESGAPVTDQVPANISINFIYLGGRLEESLLSTQTDPKGKFSSPKLVPGLYKVEALKPGYIIETIEVAVKNHEHKKAPFILKRIGEARGHSVRESEEDNIPNPGEVQIMPPAF